MNYTTRLTQNGQMTLPKHIRDLLNAKPGSQLKVSWQNGQAIVSILDHQKRLLQARQDSVKHLKKQGLYGLSSAQLDKKIAVERAEYYGKKYGVS